MNPQLMSMLMPSLLGSAGSSLSAYGQPRFASGGGAGAAPSPFGGGGGFMGGGMGGMGGMNPMTLMSLLGHGYGGQGGTQTPTGYGPYGLLGQGLQRFMGPTSQTGWNIGTSVNPASSPFRMFG